MRKVRWGKLGAFWRRRDDDDDLSAQDPDDGTIDLFWNTLTKIFKDKDQSAWAISSFIWCCKEMAKGRRYPNAFKREGEAPNRWVYYILKWTWIYRYPHRAQTDMTRDPYYALALCYAHLLGSFGGLYDKVLTTWFCSVKPKWYVYNFRFYRFWRFMQGKSKKQYYVDRIYHVAGFAVGIFWEKTYDKGFWEDKG